MNGSAIRRIVVPNFWGATTEALGSRPESVRLTLCLLLFETSSRIGAFLLAVSGGGTRNGVFTRADPCEERETRRRLRPIHATRALAMLSVDFV